VVAGVVVMVVMVMVVWCCGGVVVVVKCDGAEWFGRCWVWRFRGFLL